MYILDAVVFSNKIVKRKLRSCNRNAWNFTRREQMRRISLGSEAEPSHAVIASDARSRAIKTQRIYAHEGSRGANDA